MNVDRYNFQPVYYQLAEALRNDISSGSLKADQQMPTEEELRLQHEVSRNTVRSALKKLENEGFIYRIKGKGTFVSPGNNKILTLMVVLDKLPHNHSSIQGLLSGALVQAQESGAHLQLIAKEQLPATLENVRINPSIQAGVIFLRARDIEEETALTEKLGIPFIAEGVSSTEYNFVDIDNKSAMTAIVDHLYELGHRRFGIIRGPENDSMHFNKRYAAVLTRLNELGIIFDPAYTINVKLYGPWKNVTEKINSEFLKFPEKPTAMICFTDTMAAEFIKWCNHNNISVPEDISVTGFDNATACKFFYPGITTVDQDYFEIGSKAVGYLLEMMNNYVNRKLQLHLNLETIIRDSTGPVKTF